MKKIFSILFISLFIFSCDPDDNPVYISNEIDVDWVLVKLNSNVNGYNNNSYHFYFSDLSLTHNIIQGYTGNGGVTLQNQYEEEFHFLKINFQQEIFNYNLEDSFLGSVDDYGFYNEVGNCLPPNCGDYRIFVFNDYNPNESVSRILYNEEDNYFTIFDNYGFGTLLNVTGQLEIIDYR